MGVLEVIFWASVGLLLYTQVGYPLLLWAAAAVTLSRPTSSGELPTVSLIVAAFREQDVIAAKVANVLALDYPRDRLEVIVCCDGSDDATAQRAKAAGADLVLELPRGGKVRAQDSGVAAAKGEIVAFSDANAFWDAAALRELVSAFNDPKVGYVCGQVSFLNAAGDNQEGTYWRFEMWVRALESKLCSITAGNGAIYATRRDSYIEVDPIMGHDLSFPFNMVRRGWRAVYAPSARASEKMVPSVRGEFRRKRRMMSHAWPIVVRGGMLALWRYPIVYAFELVSHRLLRYALPFVHALAFVTNAALLSHGGIYVLAFTLQCAVLIAALVGHWRPLLVARYYVLTTASLALGFWDWARYGTDLGWEPAEGTR